jgi:hypothetical protein
MVISVEFSKFACTILSWFAGKILHPGEATA